MTTFDPFLAGVFCVTALLVGLILGARRSCRRRAYGWACACRRHIGATMLCGDKRVRSLNARLRRLWSLRCSRYRPLWCQ